MAQVTIVVAPRTVAESTQWAMESASLLNAPSVTARPLLPDRAISIIASHSRTKSVEDGFQAFRENLISRMNGNKFRDHKFILEIVSRPGNRPYGQQVPVGIYLHQEFAYGLGGSFDSFRLFDPAQNGLFQLLYSNLRATNKSLSWKLSWH